MYRCTVGVTEVFTGVSLGLLGASLESHWGLAGVSLGSRWGLAGGSLGARWGLAGVSLGARWGLAEGSLDIQGCGRRLQRRILKMMRSYTQLARLK